MRASRYARLVPNRRNQSGRYNSRPALDRRWRAARLNFLPRQPKVKDAWILPALAVVDGREDFLFAESEKGTEGRAGRADRREAEARQGRGSHRLSRPDSESAPGAARQAARWGRGVP